MRRLFELLPSRDRAALAELLDPEVVWLGTRGGLDAKRVSRGAGAFLDYLEEIEQPWEQLDVDIEQVIESGETVVAFLHERVRGRGALELDNDTAMVFRVRAGRIAEAQGYLDRDEALEAARLAK